MCYLRCFGTYLWLLIHGNAYIINLIWTRNILKVLFDIKARRDYKIKVSAVYFSTDTEF